MPLSVVIVGAGIAGLAAAIALRPFADVTILESTTVLREIGAALSLAPNAMRIVSSWGIRLESAGASPLRGIRLWGEDGELRGEAEFPVFDGTEILSIHRADLHTELLRVATAPEGAGSPCVVHLGCKVSSVDVDHAIVTTVDGRHFKADIVIGSDGIHSAVRPFVLGSTYKPLHLTEESAYRLLVPKPILDAAHPELVKKFEGSWIHQMRSNAPYPLRKLIIYWCRENEALNMICFIPSSELDEETSTKWTKQGSMEALLKSLDGLGTSWKKLMSCGTDVGLWQLSDMDPLPTWVNNRVILIGDAAHPMLPHRAQSACQAIEDAEALGAFLKETSADRVPETLRRVFRVRYKRASRAQAASHATNLQNGDGNSEQALAVVRLWDYYGAENWEKDHPEDVLTEQEVASLLDQLSV